MRWLGVGALLVACGGKPATPPEQPTPEPSPIVTASLDAGTHTVATSGSDYGTKHPTFVRAFDRTSAKWMALCQVRKDTDGNGKVEVHVGHHGEIFGDTAQLYFIIDGGEGTQVDNLVDASPDDRWVAVVRGRSLELIDTHTRAVFELVDADVEDDQRPGAAHRAARFATNAILYVRHRDQADALVIHDLATHTEREVKLPDRIWRFGLADTTAEVYTVARDQGFPRLETTLGAGECTGPAASWSSYGQQGPKPVQRYVDLAKGAEIKNPSQLPAERPRVTPTRVPTVDDGGDGPARWIDQPR